MIVKFLNSLSVIKLETCWRTANEFCASVTDIEEREIGNRKVPVDHQITVPAGFLTDFASVPRVPVAFMLAGDTAHRSAVLHDYLYLYGHGKQYADNVFYAAMIAENVPAWRRWIMYLAVKWFGQSVYDEYRKNNRGDHAESETSAFADGHQRDN